jgi:GTP-binding protein
MKMTKPIVAIVGRPNVGKSTLFNRLSEERLAVVDDVPGTTRDRLVADAEWGGINFSIVDTGGIDPSSVNKNLTPLSTGSSEYIQQIRMQAENAINEADAILFVADAENGITPADQEIAVILRQMQKKKEGKWYPPVLLVVNKADNNIRRMQAFEFFSLGFGEPYAISALHGTGTGDLLDALLSQLPHPEKEEDEDAIRVAIVGKPNVGKSSLLNCLVGAERVIVSPIAGTTRDAIDTRILFNELPIILIDTAGIRRRGRIEPGVEKYSVLRSLRAIDRAEVVILVIEATSGITAQDAHIAGLIIDSWKSVVVVVNKWDAVEKNTYTMEGFINLIRGELNFIDYVPILFVSAKTKQRTEQILPMVVNVQEERLTRLSTSQLNQVLQSAQDIHPAPSHAGRQLKIYYGTQVRTDPPTFLLYVNDPKLSHFTYERFLENQVRSAHPFLGTPIRIILRQRT